MPYTTVVAGTAITASWGNANVRDQVVTPFADAATRTSQRTAPIEGMISYLSDVDQVNFYNGTIDVPIPSTVIARANRTTSSSATTSEVGVFSLRVGTLVSGAIYKIQTGLIDFYSTVANDVVEVKFRYTTDGSDATVASTFLSGSGMQHRLTGAGVDEQHTMTVYYIPGAGVNLSLMMTVRRSAGSGNVQILASATAPIGFIVECMATDPGDTSVDA